MNVQLIKSRMFARITAALIKQGKPACEGGACRYRTADGCKCAAGHEIPDRDYSPNFEQTGICINDSNKNAISTFFHKKYNGNSEILLLLHECQAAHDSNARLRDSHSKWLKCWAKDMIDLYTEQAIHSPTALKRLQNVVNKE